VYRALLAKIRKSRPVKSPGVWGRSLLPGQLDVHVELPCGSGHEDLEKSPSDVYYLAVGFRQI
jgi:hypothetical protein